MPKAHMSIQLVVHVDSDASALEQAAANEGRRAARELYRHALGHIDRSAVDASAGVRQRVEQRWMTTLMGRVRVERYRVRTGSRTHRPLDEALNLHPGEASPGVRSLVDCLSERFSTREIAEVLTEVTGTIISRHVVLRILHQTIDG